MQHRRLQPVIAAPSPSASHHNTVTFFPCHATSFPSTIVSFPCYVVAFPWHNVIVGLVLAIKSVASILRRSISFGPDASRFLIKRRKKDCVLNLNWDYINFH
ncbi:hypothetical protein ACLB2K_065394 [Fragaria x ananassa]